MEETSSVAAKKKAFISEGCMLKIMSFGRAGVAVFESSQQKVGKTESKYTRNHKVVPAFKSIVQFSGSSGADQSIDSLAFCFCRP